MLITAARINLTYNLLWFIHFSVIPFSVGGVFWVPAIYAWLIKRYRAIPKEQTKRRIIYASLLFSITALYAVGPHRNPKVGDWIKVHKWGLWKSWLRFFAFEVVADDENSITDLIHKQAILGISPHGIFPFGLAFAALSEQSSKVFGNFRAVVATATELLPWVRDVLRWVRAVYENNHIAISFCCEPSCQQSFLMEFSFSSLSFLVWIVTPHEHLSIEH